MKGFINGVNLGGWLSQYAAYDHEHFRTFITEADIERIASWGLDHVRLPVDFPVIEAEDAPGVPLEQGYAYIDSCLAWCAKHGLGVVLDLHEAPGFTFRNDLEEDTKDRNTLFEAGPLQDRFVALWEEIVRRYAKAPTPIVFELLNEVTIPSNDPWNDLIRRTVAALRAIAPDCRIMIGGTHNNSVGGLTDLVELNDPNVVYTFHFYDPLFFTHQRAPWDATTREWEAVHVYPGELEGLAEHLRDHPARAAEHAICIGRPMDRSLLEEIVQPALDFARRTGRELYCGEFGVADWIDPASRRAWLADFMGILRDNNVGRSIWSYKQVDFGLVDGEGCVVDEDYLAVVAAEN